MTKKQFFWIFILEVIALEVIALGFALLFYLKERFNG